MFPRWRLNPSGAYAGRRGPSTGGLDARVGGLLGQGLLRLLALEPLAGDDHPAEGTGRFRLTQRVKRVARATGVIRWGGLALH